MLITWRSQVQFVSVLNESGSCLFATLWVTFILSFFYFFLLFFTFSTFFYFSPLFFSHPFNPLTSNTRKAREKKGRRWKERVPWIKSGFRKGVMFIIRVLPADGGMSSLGENLIFAVRISYFFFLFLFLHTTNNTPAPLEP